MSSTSEYSRYRKVSTRGYFQDARNRFVEKADGADQALLHLFAIVKLSDSNFGLQLLTAGWRVSTSMEQSRLNNSHIIQARRFSIIWYIEPNNGIGSRNARLKDKNDWVPIVEIIDPSLLKTFCLCTINQNQFMSSMEAVNLLTSSFKSSCQTAEADGIPPSQQDLDSVQRIFSRCTREHLGIVCSDLNPSLFDAIVSLPEYIQWSTLKHLVFSGDSIDKWIRFWPTVVDPYLRSLHICGTASTTQTFVPSGRPVCLPADPCESIRGTDI
ncbi:MAG: hypothetical protein BYD32DRAFT_439629 [Podila humilis]|nr:MAG: hypothetical protein BYD32DRAFT_439629 [Podila humilis]